MHDRNDVAETPAEPGYRLRCEGDLGHKHESALSCLKRSLDGLKVHLRLAGSRHAVKDHHLPARAQ